MGLFSWSVRAILRCRRDFSELIIYFVRSKSILHIELFDVGTGVYVQKFQLFATVENYDPNKNEFTVQSKLGRLRVRNTEIQIANEIDNRTIFGVLETKVLTNLFGRIR